MFCIYHIYPKDSYYKIEFHFSSVCGGDRLEELKGIIEENYGLEVGSIEKNKNVYKIETSSGCKCLKISKYDIGQFKFIIAVIKHLLTRDFKAVLPFNSTKSGEVYLRFETGYGFLCDWVDSREANYKNPVELKMCIDTLSNLHLASRGFVPPEETKGRNYYGRWIQRFKKRCDELLYFKALVKSRDIQTEFDNIFLKYFDVHYRQGLKAVRDLENSKYGLIMEKHKKMSGFCHHDTANHNFLITPELDMYMIDFDYCIADTFLHDLSSIVIRCLKYGHWNFDTLNFIIDTYSQNITIDDEDMYLVFCYGISTGFLAGRTSILC
jgi:CotS family spore coat protein